MENKTHDVLVIIWQLTDTSPTHIWFEKLYQPLFICYYSMYNMEGNIDINRILEYNEPSYNSVVLNWLKLFKRTMNNIRNIIKYQPRLVITLHDYQIMALLPTVIMVKVLYSLGLLSQKPKFLWEILNNPIKKYWKNSPWKWFYKFYNWYDILTSQTKANTVNILKMNPRLKNILKVCPNRTDFWYFNYRWNRIEDVNPATLKLFQGSTNFVTIWRNTEQKWQWFMIRAFWEVVKVHPNAKLFFIWAGELNEKLKQLVIDSGLQKNVYFLWRLSNPLPLLKLADFYIMTSLREWMPNTLLESISVNTLCISTDCENWPREILCPEVTYTDVLKFPYFGKYWILLPKLPTQYIFDTVQSVWLLDEELVIAETLKELLCNTATYSKKYSTIQERWMQYDRSNNTNFRKWLIQ